VSLFKQRKLRAFTGKVCEEEAQIYEDNNTYFGDLSAILIENMPIWAEFSSTPSNKTSLMSNWEPKWCHH
jgi:hypothetical protein